MASKKKKEAFQPAFDLEFPQNVVVRKDRILTMLNRVTERLLKAPAEEELLADICRIMVETGGYRLAWVGYAENDSSGRVRPVASFGFEAGYLEQLHITFLDDEWGHGPTGTAIRTGRPDVMQDILHDPRFEPWRSEAVKRGFASSAALPLMAEDKVFGALNVYASEPHAFDADETSLLADLAGNLALGVMAMREASEKRQAVEALKSSHDTLLRHQQVLLDLIRSEDFSGEKAIGDLLETAARTMNVQRVSLWRYTQDGNSILCHDLYELSSDKHSSGVILNAAAYPSYFDGLSRKEAIVADDAPTHPLTREFSESYLTPLGISSMLDIPIHLHGRLEGVLCHEHTGEPVIWSPEQRLFAVAIANLVSLALEQGERRRVEESLRASEEEYRDFFEDALTANYISTPEGEIVTCNPAFLRMFGFRSEDDALRTNFVKLYRNPKARDKFITILRQEKRLEDYEMEMMSLDGATLHVMANVIGRFGGNGELVEIKGYLYDETKRRSLEQQLVQSQKSESLGTIAGGVAHDFNNILNIIIGYASLLEGSQLDAVAISEKVKVIAEAAERGAALVRQLLTVARKTSFIYEPILINDIVEDVVKIAREIFPKTITVTTELSQGLPIITADQGQLHQVLLNLFVNARDAMPDGGVLSVSTGLLGEEIRRRLFPKASRSKHYILLSVSDTGSGIDKDVRQRIFEPFFTTKEPGKGTGLGLALVYSIVTSHKGFVDVQSENGKGTVFHLLLPAGERNVAGESEKEVAVTNIPGGVETVLLVEDEKMLQGLVQDILTAKGYSVMTASDGKEAVDLYSRHWGSIDVVVCDVGLPRIRGDEVIKRFKAINPQVRVIVASGYLEPEVQSRLAESGVQWFVQKPYRPVDLLGKVRYAIDD